MDLYRVKTLSKAEHPFPWGRVLKWRTLLIETPIFLDRLVQKEGFMKRSFFGFLLCLLTLGFATNAHNAWSQTDPVEITGALAEHSEVAAALRTLDEWIERALAEREHPGFAVGLVHDQSLIWAKGYGLADLHRDIPVTPNTIFRIGSISKVFTAIAILQLRDAGSLRLDDPVTMYLPWFSVRKQAPAGPPITIWHLLTHASGLPSDPPGVDWPTYTIPSRQEIIGSVPDVETLFATGTRYSYSNLGYIILGEIVATVSDQSFTEYVESQILEPLDMSSTDLEPDPDMPGLAVGYGPNIPGEARKARPFADTKSYTPAGDGASSVKDMAVLVSLLLRGQALAGPEVISISTLREMQRVHWLLPDWQSGRGLGLLVRRVDQQIRVGHVGDSWGFFAGFAVAPAEKHGVICLSNADDSSLVRQCVAQVFEILGPAVMQAIAANDLSRER